MAAQATIGIDGGREDSEHILDKLPPKKLLDTPNFQLIRGDVACIRSVETIKQYVAHENATGQCGASPSIAPPARGRTPRTGVVVF